MLTQLPVGKDSQGGDSVSGGMLRAPYGEGARIVVVSPDRSARVLSGGFHSACDPEVSFDAKRILFAGKRKASDHWNIYEASVDGSNVRQITKNRVTKDHLTIEGRISSDPRAPNGSPEFTGIRLTYGFTTFVNVNKNLGDCRSPSYQSTLYSLKPVGVPNEPEYHVTFVAGAGTMNEVGGCEATCLYSCKLDGSALRRLTFNLSSGVDPFLMDDGRLLFADWQRSRLDHGPSGRIGLFGVNTDGTDYALYASFEGKRIKHMPCATAGGLVVFVEAEEVPWDGAGCLSCVSIRRPLHSYRQITGETDGLFHSPSPLEDGRILVSRRPSDGSATHGVWRFDPRDKKAELLFDDPRYHEIQAKVIRPRRQPDGRSTAVSEEAVSEEQDQSDSSGKLYCLDVYTSDLKRSWLPPGSVKRLRVLEGVPLEVSESDVHLPAARQSGPPAAAGGTPPLVPRRILGDIPVEDDGSWNIEVPADTPIELQILDADGLALRTCGWIWVKGRARQGCIGCHEDPELVPENWFVDALRRPSTRLCLPPERRRTVDFRRDVMPIIDAKCVRCHDANSAPPRLDGGMEPVAHAGGEAFFNRAYASLLAPSASGDEEGVGGPYVHPGTARTSPLIWRIFGRNTSRPWDAATAPKQTAPVSDCEANRLTEDERRTFAEWIDMGASWDGIPGTDNLPGGSNHTKKGDR